MDRVQQSQPATISSGVWEASGDPADPGTVTVGVLRDDGTVLVAAGTVTSGSGPGGRTFALTGAQTATLDRLTATWTSATLGTQTTHVEVAGGFLFTITRARLRTPLQDNATYPTTQLMWARTLAESALEEIIGMAFVPRYGHDTVFLPCWRSYLDLPNSNPRVIRAIKRNGIALPSTYATGAEKLVSGLIGNGYFGAGWIGGLYDVTYEHGLDEPPGRATRAAIELARRWLVESPWDERITTYTSSERDRFDILTATIDPFDIPEVNAVARVYGSPLVG